MTNAIEEILRAHQQNLTDLNRRACEESAELSRKLMKVVGDPLATVRDLGLDDERDKDDAQA